MLHLRKVGQLSWFQTPCLNLAVAVIHSIKVVALRGLSVSLCTDWEAIKKGRITMYTLDGLGGTMGPYFDYAGNPLSVPSQTPVINSRELSLCVENAKHASARLNCHGFERRAQIWRMKGIK